MLVEYHVQNCLVVETNSLAVQLVSQSRQEIQRGKKNQSGSDARSTVYQLPLHYEIQPLRLLHQQARHKLADDNY
jgi:hypothetical protein